MAIFLAEADVRDLLSWTDVVTTVDGVLRAHAAGDAVNQARSRVFGTRGALNVHAGAVVADGYLGVKSYTVFPPDFHVTTWLYDRETGKLAAVVASLHLSALRTGALGAVAARALARPGPWEVGVFGAGLQAGAQLRALQTVGALRSVRVWSRTAAHVESFCSEMAAELRVEVLPAAPDAVGAADVVCTATAAAEPVLSGQWLRPGAHLNLIGANHHARREVDAAAVQRADRVVVEDATAAGVDGGNLIQLGESFAWDQVCTLGEVLTGAAPGRAHPAEITLFNSVGVPIADIAVAALAVRRAQAAGRGQALPF